MAGRLTVGVALGLASLMTAGCSASHPAPRPAPSTKRESTTGSTIRSAATGRAPRTDAAGTVWLCRPGLVDDPCAGDLDATAVLADGSTVSRPARPASRSAFDCFYVYPTVSTQTTDNADLTVQPAETDVAVEQAAWFSEDCRVWAPLYRQRTAASLAKGLGQESPADAVAYASLLSGWKDYLAHDNDGRPVIFVGHSQGAAMLIRLISSQIDPNPVLRRRLVSAIILGGNVQVPTGRDVGGSFEHIPGCQTADQTGCVIAYSSFLHPPPADSLFGRPGQGVSIQSGQTTATGEQVLCTNPADLGGGSGPLDPYFTTPATGSTVTTPWVEYPGLYTAHCESAGGATWLQVTDTAGAGDDRPGLTQALGPTWGLHLEDVNLALGNLVSLVAEQEAAYR